MVNDNVLSRQLNQFRQGNIQEEKQEKQEDFKSSPKAEITNTVVNTATNSLIDIFIVFFQSIIYGYAAKTLFMTNWKFVAFFCVGFSVQIILSNIFNILTKNK